MDITLLELHLHDAEFNAPFASSPAGEDDEVTRSETGSNAGDADRGRSWPLLGLLAVAGLVLAVRYLRGRPSEQSTLDEIEA